jgi:hypothetical protein
MSRNLHRESHCGAFVCNLNDWKEVSFCQQTNKLTKEIRACWRKHKSCFATALTTLCLSSRVKIVVSGFHRFKKFVKNGGLKLKNFLTQLDGAK